MKSASLNRSAGYLSGLRLVGAVVAMVSAISYARDLSATAPTINSKTAIQAPIPFPRAEDSRSIYLRGVTAEEGQGVPKDEAQAAELYRCAAEKQYAPAQYSLALLYEEGRGLKQDLALAARWYRMAAEQGYAEAQNNLGLLYKQGTGVQQDVQQAFLWFSKAALQGNVAGTTNTAYAYLEGIGTEKNFSKAFELFQVAALAGYAPAQNNVALMYANGKGIQQDYRAAYAWLSIAAEQLPTSTKLLDELRAQMTSEDVSRAKQIRQMIQEQLAANEQRTERQ